MSLFASMVSEPVRRYLSLDGEDLVPALQPEHRLTGRELRLLSLAATAPTLQSMTRIDPLRDTGSMGTARNVYEYYGRIVGNDMVLSARWRNPEIQ